MWEEYFQAGTLISWSQLQGLKPKKFTSRSLDCSCLLKSLYLGLYSWFTGKNQLVSDMEHQCINQRTILCLEHRYAVQRHLQMIAAVSSQLLQSLQRAGACWYPLRLPTLTPIIRRWVCRQGHGYEFTAKKQKNHKTPPNIHELLPMRKKKRPALGPEKWQFLGELSIMFPSSGRRVFYCKGQIFSMQ